MVLKTKEEFIAAYPAGTRILWQNVHTLVWVAGTIKERQHPVGCPTHWNKWEPYLEFLLDTDLDGMTRYLSYGHQQLIKRG